MDTAGYPPVSVPNAKTTILRLDSGFGQAGRASTSRALEGLQGCRSLGSRFGRMFAKSRNRTDLENVEGGDGAILAAKEKFAEEPPQKTMARQEETMCIICERELWGEHRALEREFFKPCKTCKKFPGTNSDGTCYHCFAVGSTIDECPECAGKPWSEEFLEAKDEIEGPDEMLVPF
jgi:hypothetical protein